MFKLKKLAACMALGLSVSTTAMADLIDARGTVEMSIKENGDLVNARRLARISSERDAILQALRLRMSIDGNNPSVQTALVDLSKQLTDNLKTTFTTEGDFLTAKTSLSVDSAQLYDLARSIKGLVSTTAMASSKIIFLIDEYYGIATNIEPGQPLETEISYSHDKSSASSESSSASSSSSSKNSAAVAAKASNSMAASESSSVAGRDRSSSAMTNNSSLAAQDGNSSLSTASNSSAAGSRDVSVSASSKSSVAAASNSSFAAASSSSKAEANSSASASASSQKDIVNYSMKQKFPDTNNAKPSDDASALITARLEQIIKPYGLTYTPERDFRRDLKGNKLLISDIEKQRKFIEYTEKASKQPFSAKYIVYGTSVMSAEGKTPSGDTVCSGMLKLQSFNVDSGEALISGTLGKRAQGSSDQDCRTNLATALATELASTVGKTAAKETQLAATQGQSFYVTLYSNKKISSAIRREFTKQLEAMGQIEEGNSTDTSRAWVIQAASGFRTKLEDVVDDLSSTNAEAKSAKMIAKGNRVVVCLEGNCPKDF